MALSVSYWSPMEKLILHLSPVARRRTLKNNSTNSTSCNNTSSLGRINRHRNRSEPNPNSRAASMKNVSVFNTTTITQSDSNSLNCDVKTLRLFYINQVESELIDKLDILVSENKGDEDYKHLFNSIDTFSDSLMENLNQKDPTWRENGKGFVESVTRLLERLLDYRNVGQGDENRDKRMSCTVNLLNFYRSEKNRKEMYLRYIYKLHDLHIPAGSYTEAAFTLKLHADDLEWSNRPLHADLRYPTQKEWQRKEQLYLKIIDYFEKDKQWEFAIPLCKELANLYEKKVFDYAKLSGILRKEANLFEKVISSNEDGLRFEPEYFRVGFYGQGFPLFLRNKEFIYRGQEWEKISTFTQRLASEFPHAQVLTSNSKEPDQSLKSEDGQFVQICCVKPAASKDILVDSSSTSFSSEVQQQHQQQPPQHKHCEPQTFQQSIEGYDMPEKIRKFHQVNNVIQFMYDRPYHKGTKDRENEFKTLWIERTTYHIESPLPGILRWFEVIKIDTIHISPIEHACETISAKNIELRNLISDPEPVLKLTQSLQGVIDAAVNGGLAKYQEAFFKSSSNNNLTNNSENSYSEKVVKLQSLMNEQIIILESGLVLHKKLASSDLLPLHSHLVDRFATMKNSVVVSRKSSIINSPLPPVPIMTNSKPEVHQLTGSKQTAEDDVNIVHATAVNVVPQVPIDQVVVPDDIYSKPTEVCTSTHPMCSKQQENNLMSTSMPYNYVWTSPNLEHYSPPPPRPPSMRMKTYNEMTHHHHHYHHHHRDSGIHVSSIGSSEDVSAPPLPPRSAYGSMTFSSSRSSRMSTFSSLTAMETTSLTSTTSPTIVTSSSNLDHAGTGSVSPASGDSPPKLSPRTQEEESVPPPIPPKKLFQESGV